MGNILIRGWLTIWNLLPAASGPARALIFGAIGWPLWHGIWNWLFGTSRENQLVPIPGVTNATVAFVALAGVTFMLMRMRRR